MNKKIVFIIFLIIFIPVAYFVLGYFCWPAKTQMFISKVCREIKFLPDPIRDMLFSRVWNIHADEKHGFSFQYPLVWQSKPVGYTSYYITEGEPSGVSIIVSEIANCSSASNYAAEVLIPQFGPFETKPISNTKVDGFVITGKHLDDLTKGSEIFIVNCPYLIRLGFNPDGIPDGDEVFERIIRSVKTWTPKTEN